jgi:ribulose-5-phosphate 4-epimerase/fuculose-1-phosphate aldolase
MKKIVVIGGGTISHVRNHLALCAPAYGKTATDIAQLIINHFEEKSFVKTNQLNKTILKNNLYSDIISVELYKTSMAGGNSKLKLETNDDIELLVDQLINDKDVRCIFFNVALVDFTGQLGDVPSGKYSERLKTKNGTQELSLIPSNKIIGKIRQKRKDIFVIGFKTTCDATPKEQYIQGLELLKKNSLNLVLANDTKTRNNIIIVPEEAWYENSKNRQRAIQSLVDITLMRMENTFTQSSVVDGEIVHWHSKQIPDNLRTVVDHCIKNGAYKPFLGKTAGHFAVKLNNNEILTSIRKTNFNELDKNGLVRVTYNGKDSVIAHGAKPSVGGMSQKIIFSEHPDAECIVHFHCPPKADVSIIANPDFLKDLEVATRPQMQNECGSHQCGQNTSDGLFKINLGGGDYLKAVYLDNHGPNIVFSKSTPAYKIIDYINKTFDLKEKTGGLLE